MAEEEYKLQQTSWRVNLIGSSCSATLAFLVLVHRLRRSVSPRVLKRLKVAISPGTEASTDAPSSPLHIQARQVVSNVQRAIAHENQKGRRRTFLQDAGVVLLALDLLASVMRIWLLLLDGQWPPPHHSHHSLLTGLVVQTCYLQALWLLFTHFVIVACIDRKQTVVTGPLFWPLVAVLLVWIILGMGPTAIAELADLYEPNVRSIQNAVGGLVGMLLLLGLLQLYHKALKRFGLPEEEGDTALTSGRYESDMSMSMSATSCGSAAAEMSGAGNGTPRGPETEGGRLSPRAHTQRGSLGSSGEAHSVGMLAMVRPSGGGGGGGGLPTTPRAASSIGMGMSMSISRPRSKRAVLLERRLRRALYRVLQLYVLTFLCVIVAGIVAIDRQSVASRVLVLLLEIPYSLLGVADAVVVEGHSMRSRRLSKAGAKERARRKNRMEGATDDV